MQHKGRRSTLITLRRRIGSDGKLRNVCFHEYSNEGGSHDAMYIGI